MPPRHRDVEDGRDVGRDERVGVVGALIRRPAGRNECGDVVIGTVGISRAAGNCAKRRRRASQWIERCLSNSRNVVRIRNCLKRISPEGVVARPDSFGEQRVFAEGIVAIAGRVVGQRLNAERTVAQAGRIERQRLDAKRRVGIACSIESQCLYAESGIRISGRRVLKRISANSRVVDRRRGQSAEGERVVADCRIIQHAADRSEQSPRRRPQRDRLLARR